MLGGQSQYRTMTVSADSANKKIEEPVHDVIKRCANILISGGLTWFWLFWMFVNFGDCSMENIDLLCCIK